MKRKEILNYPDIMLKAYLKMILNVNLLNIFVFTLFSKTKYFLKYSA
jgi:hypothetical protein